MWIKVMGVSLPVALCYTPSVAAELLILSLFHYPPLSLKFSVILLDLHCRMIGGVRPTYNKCMRPIKADY